jgi:ribonuclease VapC
MVVDTSALVAIALGESSQQALLYEIEAAPRRIISSVSLLEAGLVLRARWGQMAVALLSRLVEDLGGEIVPFDGVQARLGIAAFGRFGKGMRHRAQLNLGDCAVYALAVSLGEPLLATGNDFAATDLIVIRP